MGPENRFIADVHLGKLARWLRLLGFDTAYKNSYTAVELLKTSREENRVLLSRNKAFTAMADIRCFITASEEPFEQLQQVVRYFHLKEKFRPFSRCLVCNGALESVDKEKIVDLLQQNTIDYFDAFWQCRECKRVYWKGSHYERMLKTMERITA